jgi:hypothetical protein
MAVIFDRAALVTVLLLSACTSVSGPCTREVTTMTRCEPGGAVIVVPPTQ